MLQMKFKVYNFNLICWTNGQDGTKLYVECINYKDPYLVFPKSKSNFIMHIVVFMNNYLGMDEMKFAMWENNLLNVFQKDPVSDVLHWW